MCNAARCFRHRVAWQFLCHSTPQNGNTKVWKRAHGHEQARHSPPLCNARTGQDGTIKSTRRSQLSDICAAIRTGRQQRTYMHRYSSLLVKGHREGIRMHTRLISSSKVARLYSTMHDYLSKYAFTLSFPPLSQAKKKEKCACPSVDVCETVRRIINPLVINGVAR